MNAIADRTAANYPSLAAELRRIASGIHSAEAQAEPDADASHSSA